MCKAKGLCPFKASLVLVLGAWLEQPDVRSQDRDAGGIRSPHSAPHFLEQQT